MNQQAECGKHDGQEDGRQAGLDTGQQGNARSEVSCAGQDGPELLSAREPRRNHGGCEIQVQEVGEAKHQQTNARADQCHARHQRVAWRFAAPGATAGAAIEAGARCGMCARADIRTAPGIGARTNIRATPGIGARTNIRATPGMGARTNIRATPGMDARTNIRATPGMGACANIRAALGMGACANIRATPGMGACANIRAALGMGACANIRAALGMGAKPNAGVGACEVGIGREPSREQRQLLSGTIPRAKRGGLLDYLRAMHEYDHDCVQTDQRCGA